MGNITKVTDCTLPKGADKIFDLVEPVFSRHFNPSSYALGGDTALAAVLCHRDSTDIDLFMDSTAYRSVSMNDGLRTSLENDLWDTLRPMRLDVMRGRMKILMPEGEISLSTADAPIHVEHPFRHSVAGSTVAIEPPELVISRKIQDRMISKGVFMVQDLYDIAAAAVLDRDALVAALDTMTDKDRYALRRELGILPLEWVSRSSSTCPIFDVARMKHLVENVEHCVHIVMAVFAEKWSVVDALCADASPRASATDPRIMHKMSLDLDAVRAAYAAGPPSDKFVGAPTREERIAESERELLRLCINNGRDPKAECLGQHGALIGGSSKPGRKRSLVSRLAEDYAPVRLAPLSWFRHDTPSAMSEDGGYGILEMLIASYMAGTPKKDRPTPDQMRQAFYANLPSGIKRFWLHEILACARIRELRSVIQETGMSLGTFVRSLHNTDVRRHDVADWMNQFAVAPAPVKS